MKCPDATIYCRKCGNSRVARDATGKQTFCKFCEKRRNDARPRIGPKAKVQIDIVCDACGETRLRYRPTGTPSICKPCRSVKRGVTRTYRSRVETAKQGELACSVCGLIRLRFNERSNPRACPACAKRRRVPIKLHVLPQANIACKSCGVVRERYTVTGKISRCRPCRVQDMTLFYRNNPDKDADRASKRRSMLAGVDGHHTTAEFRAKCAAQGNACFDCKRVTALTRGHLVPISKGGPDYIDNIVGQCRSCNSKQNSRIHPSVQQPLAS